MTQSTTLILIGSLAVAISACATPVDPNAEQSMAERVAALPDNGEISNGDTFTCRRIQITGTRRFERICASDAEWDEQADRTNEAVNAIGVSDRSQVRPDIFDPRPPGR